jgi:hypothetical protein
VPGSLHSLVATDDERRRRGLIRRLLPCACRRTVGGRRWRAGRAAFLGLRALLLSRHYKLFTQRLSIAICGVCDVVSQKIVLGVSVEKLVSCIFVWRNIELPSLFPSFPHCFVSSIDPSPFPFTVSITIVTHCCEHRETFYFHTSVPLRTSNTSNITDGHLHRRSR